jgi:hypothetical protein
MKIKGIIKIDLHIITGVGFPPQMIAPDIPVFFTVGM